MITLDMAGVENADEELVKRAVVLATRFAEMGWLECDGLSLVLHTVFNAEMIHHYMWTGIAWWEGDNVIAQTPPHYWLTIGAGDRFFLDYRLRMWLGKAVGADKLPHGAFILENYPRLKYEDVQQVSRPPLDDTMFDILTDKSLNTMQIDDLTRIVQSGEYEPPLPFLKKLR